jgi:hypothetical protein
VVRFENLVLGDGTPGFTVWPAQVPDNRYATRDNGTEYFLSSSAAEGPLDSNDSRMQQTWLAGGRLYGALDTIANVAGNIVNYPAIAVLPSGKGVMAFTLVGGNHYPSAAYAPLSGGGGNVGAVHIAGRGVGPQDGFSEYVFFNGAGGNLWFASEWIAQRCTFTQYLADTTCGGTRGALGNWSTHLSRLSS